MDGKKIESLNLAIRESVKPMQDVADENPNAEVLVRAISFSDEAKWHMVQAVEIHQFKWTDVTASGTTAMGHALMLAAEAMKTENMPQRGLPPVLVLISDGMPNDEKEYAAGLSALMAQPWGGKAVRVAVAIGDDADLDVLQRFIGNNEIPPLRATNVQDLVKKIKWASTVPLKAASSPATHTKTKDGQGSVPIPAPDPGHAAPSTPADVF
jgi:uncharacterized protein YegL